MLAPLIAYALLLLSYTRIAVIGALPAADATTWTAPGIVAPFAGELTLTAAKLVVARLRATQRTPSRFFKTDSPLFGFPGGTGVIVRTQASGELSAKLRTDLLWLNKAGTLMFQKLDTQRGLRR
jgi:pilus assembly protein TadC